MVQFKFKEIDIYTHAYCHELTSIHFIAISRYIWLRLFGSLFRCVHSYSDTQKHTDTICGLSNHSILLQTIYLKFKSVIVAISRNKYSIVGARIHFLRWLIPLKIDEVRAFHCIKSFTQTPANALTPTFWNWITLTEL